VPSIARHRPSYADFEVAATAVPPVDDRLVHQVPVADIRPSPRNPRQRLEGLDELAASIAEHQLLQPVVVRRRGRDGYELIAGHRRLEAVKSLGWTEIPAVVRDETPAKAYILTLVENLQREDLTPKEEAAGLEVLMREHHWSTRQVADSIHRSHTYVGRRLRVFEDDILAGPVLDGQLAVSTAEELLRAEPDARAELVERAIAEAWDQGDARRAVRGWKVTFQDDSFEQQLKRHLKTLRKDVVRLDPERVAPSTLAEVENLLWALQQFVKKSSPLTGPPR
jgi:ParB family transcriptional regulator, chromosome partitioning protein